MTRLVPSCPYRYSSSSTAFPSASRFAIVLLAGRVLSAVKPPTRQPSRREHSYNYNASTDVR